MRPFFQLSILLVLSFAIQPLRALDRDQVVKWLYMLKAQVDSADYRGVDPDYLELPEYGFVAYSRASLTGTHLTVDYELPNTTKGDVNLTGRLNTDIARLFSLGISYRGWGLSYSFDMASKGDTEWEFASYGQTYGFEARLHTSNTLSGDLKEHFFDLNAQPVLSIDVQDFKQKTILANFYWVFNHSQFSLPAAMSHTVIQRRSAGSFLAILNLHHAGSRVDDPDLSFMISPAFATQDEPLRSQFRKLTQTQLSVGGGYAYNYVFPNQQLLLHGSFMPMISLWHRNRTYWDFIQEDESGKFLKVSTYDSSFGQKAIALNASMHLNLVYNKGRYLTGLMSMLNIDSLPSKGSLTIYTFDWSSRFFFGIRF